ncbi:uncharacterized protein LOC134727372 [Mytilus trossulus]|uniref:uncharacterized protein LOC134727372 n=1 Tax=Mytilus trossulus TaxID=6551 RepID=UPI003005CC1E
MTVLHWTTVFVACPGNSKSVLKAWSAYAWNGYGGVTFASVVEDADTCKESHQADPIINEWRSSHIKQVRLRLWKNGEIVVQITFNGTNTHKFNWFTQSRLLATTYSDLEKLDTRLRFFSLIGYGNGVNRRFYINKINSGCDEDAGWMFVKDDGYRQNCLYDSYRKYPYFLYATNGHAGFWQTEGDYDFADMMSIQVLQGKDVEREVAITTMATTTILPEELWVPF